MADKTSPTPPLEAAAEKTVKSPKAGIGAIDPAAAGMNAIPSKEEHRLTIEQEEAYGKLLKEILTNGQWGYKSERDPLNREIAFQSEKASERIYGYLYRHDPKKADKLWEEYTGHTPTDKFHKKIEGQAITQSGGKALPELTDRVDAITSGISAARQNELHEKQRQQLPHLEHMLGEGRQRQIDYRRKALQGTFQKEGEENGITILKTAMRGFAHGREGMIGTLRERDRAKQIGESIKELKANIMEGRRQQIIGNVNQGYSSEMLLLEIKGSKTAAQDEKIRDTVLAGLSKTNGKELSNFNGQVMGQKMSALQLASAALGHVRDKTTKMVDTLTGNKGAASTANPGVQQGPAQQMPDQSVTLNSESVKAHIQQQQDPGRGM